jgi:hypothetical protein
MLQKRDSQRAAVYSWERALEQLLPAAATRRLSLVECDLLVVRVWSDYGHPCRPPTVTDGRCRRSAAYNARTNEIKLPRWARSQLVVLHEVAHALTPAVLFETVKRPRPHRQGFLPASHGPEFARLALDLFARYLPLAKGEIRSLGVNQKPRRVRFARVGTVPQVAPVRQRGNRLAARQRD